jgi:hypothetical protein
MSQEQESTRDQVCIAGSDDVVETDPLHRLQHAKRLAAFCESHLPQVVCWQYAWILWAIYKKQRIIGDMRITLVECQDHIYRLTWITETARNLVDRPARKSPTLASLHCAHRSCHRTETDRIRFWPLPQNCKVLDILLMPRKWDWSQIMNAIGTEQKTRVNAERQVIHKIGVYPPSWHMELAVCTPIDSMSEDLIADPEFLQVLVLDPNHVSTCFGLFASPKKRKW